jgi:putative transcriptional regulator
MSKKLKSEDRRVLDELLEMAQALDEQGLLTKHDYAKMKTLCLENPLTKGIQVLLV